MLEKLCQTANFGQAKTRLEVERSGEGLEMPLWLARLAADCEGQYFGMQRESGLLYLVVSAHTKGTIRCPISLSTGTIPC